MAASAFVLYNAAKRNMLRGIVDLDTDTLRAYLYKSSSNASTTGLILIGSFTNAVNAAGYTGAKTLGNGTSLVRASGDAAVFDVSNFIFTASNADVTSIMYLVVAASGSGGNQAVCWSKLSASAFSVSSGNTLTIQVNSAGVFALT
jgi:hypothetical protein